MEAEWKEIPFSEAVLLNPPTPLKRDTVYPFVDMQAIAPNTRGVRCSEHREFTGGGSRFHNQDTLMARITPCLENGKIARFIAPENEPIGHGSTEFIVVRGRPGVSDNDYAYYLTISPEVRNFAISQMTGSSGRQRVPTDSLGNISILLPTLGEQKTIAGILSVFDDKIELNRRTNETLEILARSIFKSWFVDTIQSGLPKGWREGRLGDLADVTWGDTNTTKASYLAQGFPAYSAAGCDGFLPHHDFDRIGVVVSAIGANAGVTWLALGKWSCIKNTIRFWATEDEVSTEYLFYATLGKEKWPLRGSAQPFIAQGDARAMKIIVPSNQLAKRFGKIVEPLHFKITANDEESRTLAALRDALLPKLLSGELRVPEAEIFAEAPA